jgi:PKD repeat protein
MNKRDIFIGVVNGEANMAFKAGVLMSARRSQETTPTEGAFGLKHTFTPEYGISDNPQINSDFKNKLMKVLQILTAGLCFMASGIAWAQCPPNTNNLLRGTATVCATGNMGKVYVSDPTFTVEEWFYSHDNQNWTTTAGSDTLFYANLTQTTYYKANVKYSTCSVVPSNTIAVAVVLASDAGVITGATKGCRYTHSGVLTLENYTGTVREWLVYDTIAKAWNSVANTTAQYNFANLATETQYRTVVKNSVCEADTSAIATVGVYLLPEVAFNDPSGCFGTAMQFNENVTKSYEVDNALSSYLWNFDDGTTSTERFPQKTYTNARVYNVTLTAVTSKSCSRSLTKSLCPSICISVRHIRSIHHFCMCLNPKIQIASLFVR